MNKKLSEYTREEFLAMENFGEDQKFTGIIIVPTDDLHDSGYRTMKFILTKRGSIVGAVSGWSDVVHINGIGGYGRNWEHTMTTQMVPRTAWSIDCLPVSGCVRLFTDKLCRAEDFIGSDFVFYVEGK